MLRDLVNEDLSAVTCVHMSAFPASALTRLGVPAVYRYYEWLLNGPHDAVSLGVFDDNILAGYLFGGRFNGAVSGFVRKNRIFLVGQVLKTPSLFFTSAFRPRLRTGMRSLVRRSANRSSLSTKNDFQKSFGVLAIAVSPQNQGTGIGRQLMEEAETVARARKFDLMNLSVGTTNQQAITFYEGIGWQRVIEDGEWAGRMTKSLVARRDDDQAIPFS